MRWTLGTAWRRLLTFCPASGSLAADSSVYHDAETGFTFSQFAAAYVLTSTVTFRLALPSPAPTNASYDAVLQVVAPISLTGWVGLAWGGTMLNNPLTVFWENNNTPVISTRFATTRSLPPVYSGATLQVFKTGTHVNSTHWQFTAKCTGCTAFTSSSGSKTVLNPTGVNRLAFAYGSAKPSTPSSSSSSFGVHDVYAYWNHDFSAAGNTAFSSLVAKNLGTAVLSGPKYSH
ncbi:Cellobiose dehydrogenase [Lachnellula suecica]|uniref:Cellobiose dehydrogenase n=1 Tax=Lachnellula suecica TaxID=602035 RepID=A0A8T9C7M9_9HELO|nr:Cellobiose dehydrogenase [Lachnellula suecica]